MLFPGDNLGQKKIGSVFTVRHTLRTGFLESVYENAPAVEIKKSGLQVAQQYPIKIK
ncbi:MAG: GxxExxY protein [Anaerolineales bacterium]|nr:GxxExxY protein [Anaerolineales bacterium]